MRWTEWLPESPLTGPPLPKWLGITWPWLEPASPPSGEAAAVVSLSFNAPVLEGQSATLTVTVTNASTRAGAPAGATLTTIISIITTDGTVVLPEQTDTHNYAASEQKRYPLTVVAPLGKGGQSLAAKASVYDPNNVNIASATASEPITSIPPAPIKYAATVTIG